MRTFFVFTPAGRAFLATNYGLTANQIRALEDFVNTDANVDRFSAVKLADGSWINVQTGEPIVRS